jgi:hypothetical protein
MTKPRSRCASGRRVRSEADRDPFWMIGLDDRAGCQVEPRRIEDCRRLGWGMRRRYRWFAVRPDIAVAATYNFRETPHRTDGTVERGLGEEPSMRSARARARFLHTFLATLTLPLL